MCSIESWSLKDIHALMPGTCDYVTLQGKGTLSMITERTLRLKKKKIILYDLGVPNLISQDFRNVKGRRKEGVRK